MNEKGKETLRGLLLNGVAARLRDSNASSKSTQPAGLFSLNTSMNSEPKISTNRSSKPLSTPAQHTQNLDVRGALKVEV